MRSLIRTPAFFVGATLILALGVSGNAILFGIIDRVLLKGPEHVRAADELRRVVLMSRNRAFHSQDIREEFSWDEFTALSDGLGCCTASAAYAAPSTAALRWKSRVLSIRVMPVSSTFFLTLGTKPEFGHFLSPSSGLLDTSHEAVLSDDLWHTLNDSNPGALRSALELDGQVYTVAGIAPPRFSGPLPDKVDLWIPAEGASQARYGPRWRTFASVFSIVLRVAPDWETVQATAEVTNKYIHREGGPPVQPQDIKMALESILPGRSLRTWSRSIRLSFAVGAVTILVLVLAVVNLSGLLLLRAVTQARATAIRLVLGIGKARLCLSILSESVLLSVLSAGASCALISAAGGPLRRTLLQSEWASPALNVRVAVYTFCTALGCSLAASAASLLFASSPGIIAAVKSGSRQSSRYHTRLRSSFVTAQVSLALLLLAGLSMNLRSLQRASTVDFGFDVNGLITVEVGNGSRPGVSDAAVEQVPQLADEIRTIPGVTAVAVTSTTPIVGISIASVGTLGADQLLQMNNVRVTEVSADFFDVMRLRVSGRPFSEVEVAQRAPLAIVNETMARKLWNGRDPLGKCVYIGEDRSVCRTVVGVSHDIRDRLESYSPVMSCFLPLGSTRAFGASRSLIVRTFGDPHRLVPKLRSSLESVRPETPAGAVETLQDILEPQVRPWKTASILYGVFGLLALAMAVTGVFGSASFFEKQYRHDIGIRSAIGGYGFHLVRPVFEYCMLPVLWGVTLGCLLAIPLQRYLISSLFESQRRDYVSILVAATALLAAALIACMPSALAALRVNPIESLRVE